jgi:hypothetical protein
MSTEPNAQGPTGPLPQPTPARYCVRCVRRISGRDECVHDFGVIAAGSAADATRIARERVMRGEVWLPIRLPGGLEWDAIVAPERWAEA